MCTLEVADIDDLFLQAEHCAASLEMGHFGDGSNEMGEHDSRASRMDYLVSDIHGLGLGGDGGALRHMLNHPAAPIYESGLALMQVLQQKSGPSRLVQSHPYN